MPLCSRRHIVTELETTTTNQLEYIDMPIQYVEKEEWLERMQEQETILLGAFRALPHSSHDGN